MRVSQAITSPESVLECRTREGPTAGDRSANRAFGHRKRRAQGGRPMTEAEWLTKADVEGMIHHLREANSADRKYGLFALDCVQRIRSNFKDARSICALDFVEANAEKPFKRLRGLRPIQSAAMTVAPVPIRTSRQDGYRTDEWPVDLRAAHAACALLDQAWVAALHRSHQTAESMFSAATGFLDPVSNYGAVWSLSPSRTASEFAYVWPVHTVVPD